MKQILYTLTLFIVLNSCTENQVTVNSQDNSTPATITFDTVIMTDNSEVQNIIKLRADSFIRSILDTNALHWTFEPQDEDMPRYLEFFKQDGIKRIYAYSNKNYPRKSKASQYKHFLLFLIEYQNKDFAKASFNRFLSDTETYNSDTETYNFDKDQTDKQEYDRIMLILGYAKSGGLVGQKDNYLLSLVENCGFPFKFRTWPEYEKNFIETIFDKSDSGSTILNANCGKTFYVKQKIK